MEQQYFQTETQLMMLDVHKGLCALASLCYRPIGWLVEQGTCTPAFRAALKAADKKPYLRSV